VIEWPLNYARLGCKGTHPEPVRLNEVLAKMITHLALGLAESRAGSTLNNGPSLNGRTSARNGLVSLDNNNATAYSVGPVPPVPPPATIRAGIIPTPAEWSMLMRAALMAIADLAVSTTRATRDVD
jgi:hypothetical protein